MPYHVYFVADMVTIEDREHFKSVLWEPFNKATPIERTEGLIYNNLKEIIGAFNAFCVRIDPIAKERTEKTKFNGYRAWVQLAKGERKPPGWNKSNSLEFEKQFDNVGEEQT